jgi:hypothetical protein
MPKRKRAQPIVEAPKPPRPPKPQPLQPAKLPPKAPASVAKSPRPPNSRDVRLAEGRCWDPDASFKPCSLATATLQQLALRDHHPLALAAARGKSLHSLRALFGEQLQSIGLIAADDRSSPVVGAFERWHFGWLLAAAAAQPATPHRLDPLLPAVQAPEADATLASELMLKRREQEGASDRDAAAVVARLRRAADKAAAALATRLAGSARVENDPVTVELALAKGEDALWHVTTFPALWSGGALKIADEHLTKLRALHARTAAAARAAASRLPPSPTGVEEAQDEEVQDEEHDEEHRFRIDLVRLLLRYKSIGGSGFQVGHLPPSPVLSLCACI